MRVLILANGESPSPEFAQSVAARHDLLLATDGAAHRAAGLGLSPQIICGDFDSVDLAVARIAFPKAEFIPTPDQNQADLEKAIGVATERGATQISILGASGGRIDHMLANFSLLLRYHVLVPLRILEETSEVWAVSDSASSPGECRIAATPGDTISLLSLHGTAQVTISGVQWPLDAYRLPIGTQGVSNVADAEEVLVRVEGGTLLVCHLKRPPLALDTPR